MRQQDARAFISSLRLQVAKLPEMAAQQVREAVESRRRQVLAEQTARSGGIAPDLAAIWVDGVRGAALDAARPPRVVTLDWSYLTEACVRALDHLKAAGPQQSGAWKDSILCLVNGQEMDPIDIPATATEAVVAVGVPYGRRLEVGTRKGGGPFVLQVQQHFVEHAAIQLNRRHGDLARFSFTYVELSGGHRLASPIRRGRHTQTHTRQPAIRIREHQL